MGGYPEDPISGVSTRILSIDPSITRKVNVFNQYCTCLKLTVRSTKSETKVQGNLSMAFITVHIIQALDLVRCIS